LLDLGRSAIQVALLGAEIPPGKEVIIPSFACIGVIMPVIQAGLSPVLADVDDDFNLSFSAVQEVYSPDTAAVILPHLSGAWAKDAERIIEWAKHNNVFVIEDISQAMGLHKNGKMAGTLGDVGIFSIGAGKPLLGPNGGGIITSNARLNTKLKALDLPTVPREIVENRNRSFLGRYSSRFSLRKRGCLQVTDYIVSMLSLFKKSRLETNHSDPFEPWRFTPSSMPEEWAFFGNVALNRFNKDLDEIRKNALLVHESLTYLENRIHLPGGTDNTFAKFLIWGSDSSVLQRLRNSLFASGVMIEPSYVPLHLREPFSKFRRGSMKNVERQWQGAFSIPVWPGIDTKRVCRAVSRMNL
jgi:dTDP-4-amino-4,6-dideoxygalactose transaminase